MKILSHLSFVVFVSCALSACNNTSPEKKAQNEEEKIQSALAKLSETDRKLAEAQKFCTVHSDERLGSMGTPVKLTLKNGAVVFLCCAGCMPAAKKDEDATLKKANELKAANK